MANTSPVYARIDTELKENAEGILARLGVTPTSMIQMLYSQIVLRQGIPFEVKLTGSRPVAEAALTKEQFDAELWKGVASMRAGNTIPADAVDDAFERKYAE